MGFLLDIFHKSSGGLFTCIIPRCLSNLAEMAELAAVSSSAGASSLKAAGRLAMAADAEHVDKR